jgi:hypothetical protein
MLIVTDQFIRHAQMWVFDVISYLGLIPMLARKGSEVEGSGFSAFDLRVFESASLNDLLECGFMT